MFLQPNLFFQCPRLYAVSRSLPPPRARRITLATVDPRELGKSFQIHLQIASAEIGQLLPVFDRNCAGWHLCSSSVIRPLLERNDLAGLWKLSYFTQHMLAGGCQSDFYFPENTCMRLQIDRCSVAFNAVALWTMSITTAPSAINAHPGCSMSSC